MRLQAQLEILLRIHAIESGAGAGREPYAAKGRCTKMRTRLRSLVCVVCAGLAVVSSFSFGAAVVVAAVDRQPSTSLERFDLVTGELARRMAIAEVKLEQLSPDVAVMKSDMTEVKWIARGAASVVVLQVLMSVFRIPIKRRRADDEVEVEAA